MNDAAPLQVKRSELSESQLGLTGVPGVGSLLTWSGSGQLSFKAALAVFPAKRYEKARAGTGEALNYAVSNPNEAILGSPDRGSQTSVSG